VAAHGQVRVLGHGQRRVLLIARARQAGELAPSLSEDQAVEWAALVLMVIETLPGSAGLDITDPRAVGRTFAERICQGIAAP